MVEPTTEQLVEMYKKQVAYNKKYWAEKLKGNEEYKAKRAAYMREYYKKKKIDLNK